MWLRVLGYWDYDVRGNLEPGTLKRVECRVVVPARAGEDEEAVRELEGERASLPEVSNAAAREGTSPARSAGW